MYISLPLSQTLLLGEVVARRAHQSFALRERDAHGHVAEVRGAAGRAP